MILRFYQQKAKLVAITISWPTHPAKLLIKHRIFNIGPGAPLFNFKKVVDDLRQK